MKRLNGKVLDLVLLILCFSLLIIVIPTWISLFIVCGILTLCFISMINCNFFGRF